MSQPDPSLSAAWPDDVPERLTDGQLDQWEASALTDHEAGKVWSVNPLAVLSVVRELRMYREWIVSEDAGPTFDDAAPRGDR